MKVSVVIPSYNARTQLGRLLRCLAGCWLDAGDSLEVVVADDGSTDGTGDLVSEFTADLDLVYVFLPRSPTSGRAAARNAGIEKASGELVLMADADQLCGPDFVLEHLRFHRLRDDLVVVGPRHDLADGPFDDARLAQGFALSALPEVVAGDGRELVLAEFSENFNNLETCWHHMFSCNVSVRREHLLAVGGFDEGFVGWGLEDSELGYRLRRAGHVFAFNSTAVVYQKGRDVTPDMFGEWRRNLAYFMDKHRSAPEVCAQTVVCRVFDPADRSIGWLESMRRLEFAARAFAGRLPRPASFAWVEADDTNVADILAGLPERAATQDLIIIDDSAAAVLAGPVQCLDTTRDVLYFRRPTAEVRASVRARHLVGRAR
ncbi:GT2 family glycosyltransferase [Kitasatospora sp. MAP12-15]|uniref:glycosyltransferase n=1 Tax=unclassified Kitasatospora TaxID=2633591 RepID=UPI0024737550|nr:glycosyltransferase [Kitasatospora sp. MAP12-44]MDH6108211.1 GT2 family glycosyltransferase [Kitasatospora sp. MAP12-44]